MKEMLLKKLRGLIRKSQEKRPEKNPEEDLRSLEEKVRQKLQTLQSQQNTKEAVGLRGPMIGFRERLIGDDGKKYKCAVVTDIQRLEIEVIDLCPTDGLPIRKYRVFLGRLETNEEVTTWDLSCWGDQTFSWRRNTSDNDYPEKSLTLEQSCQFMREILAAHPESSQPTPPKSLLK
jgi:hypothetical protein